MECLGVEPGAAWWKAKTNPLSYGVTPSGNYLAVIVGIEFWEIASIVPSFDASLG